MPVDRPTFSESWYRVKHLKPRLRATIQTYRQHYRGDMWYVVRDPSNNQFFRLSDAAYHFIGLLDGRKSVEEAWHLANDHLGDRAPTQNEAIHLLGQLYTSNLLQADLPADTEGMFERYRKRVRREVGGYMMNLLFARIPIWDPDAVLDRWIGAVGWIFSWVGFVLWLAILAVGGYFLIGRADELLEAADPQALLQWENLILLYVGFAFIKLFHELGHGFACKKFGRDAGSGGEVHTIGIMFLVFMPVPYVDASSAWALRNKWHRAIIGAAGIFVELAVAALAGVVWANTSPDSLVNAICYNMMFIASVSTILFNGNPLLRFDGYYILSDILEIPNLYQRSKDYLYYLVKKYVYGVRRPRNPAQTFGERIWLFIYAIAAAIYRVIIFVGIFIYVSSVFFGLGILLALVGLVSWIGMPLGKFVKYLATNDELNRTRTRAVLTTVGFVVLLVAGIGLIPAPDYDRADGFIEARRFTIVHMGADGFVDSVLDSGRPVSKAGGTLVSADNVELRTMAERLEADLRIATARRRASRSEDIALAQALGERIGALREQIQLTNRRLEDLTLEPPASGTWVSPEAEQFKGAFVPRGQQLGLIISLDDLLVRVTTDQHLGPRLNREVGEGATVEMKLRNRPDIELKGEVEKIFRAAQLQLPSPALSTVAGGSMRIDTSDQSGAKAAEPFFEVWIDPEVTDLHEAELLNGQRVVVRFRMPDKPLGRQWWLALRQLVQERFGL